jgi:hypothetical protein
MNKISRISLLSLGLLGLLVLSVSAQIPTPLGDFKWNRYQEEKNMTREEAVAKYNYCPTGGCVIRFEDVQVSPASAHPGDTLTLTTTYTLLTATDTPIPVSITREIFYQGKSLGQTKLLSTRNLNGTWTQRVEFPVARDASPGIYTLVSRINTGYGSDEKSVQFAVQ